MLKKMLKKTKQQGTTVKIVVGAEYSAVCAGRTDI